MFFCANFRADEEVLKRKREIAIDYPRCKKSSSKGKAGDVSRPRQLDER